MNSHPAPLLDRLIRMLRVSLALWVGGQLAPSARAQITSQIAMATNREAVLTLKAAPGTTNRIEFSQDLRQWQALTTLLMPNSGASTHTDSAAPFVGERYFRVVQPTETNALTGDHIQTGDGEIVIHPVNHASFVMIWKNLVIYNDPVGGAALYKSFPRADLILVSHDHGDHFDPSTLAGVRNTNACVIIAPRVVYNSMTALLKGVTTILTNGSSTNLLGLSVEAVPAYNGNHPKGNGNGYLVSLGGTRIYMAGDTGNTAEMRALQDIDIAFLCMNVPFTMTINDALAAIRGFKPKVVYPYHFRNSDNSLTDLNSLKRQLGTETGTEVRIRKWY